MASKKADKGEAEPEGDEEMKEAQEAAEPAEEAKEPEKPKETEEDAPADSRAKLPAGDAATFLTEDTTVNVMSTVSGRMLTSLSEGGMQYLVAGARASVGIKAGRYMFEVKITESRSPGEPAGAKAPPPKPRQLVRVGFATAEASLLLPDAAESACFDTEGNFHSGKDRTKASQKFGHDQIIAVLLNLDAGSPNANTMSLFRDGTRISQPQRIPESLVGKELFPAVTYRNVTLQVNFGPHPLKPLPFSCRTVNDAAKADAVAKKASAPAGGKYEVMFPVGLPDEGTFDWLDQFLATNKDYVELSDRAILDWAAKSGIQRPRGYAWRSSNDRPDMGFGLPLLDDLSASRVLMTAAPALQRNFVVMHVRGNLLAEERKAMVAKFPTSDFRRTAKVMMGEPPAEFRSWVQDQVLEVKRAKAEAEAKRKKVELIRKKQEEDRKKKAEAAKKARIEAAKRAKEAREKRAAGEEPAEEPEKAEEKEAEEADEAEIEVPVEEVSLTEEEKKLTFRKKDAPDLSPKDIALSFSKFTLPAADEGFDEVAFPWQDEEKCKEYLRDWVLAKKLTERVEDLQPSEWFKGKWSEWTKLLSQWRKKQQEFKDPAAKKKAALAKKKAEEDGEEGAEKQEKMDINAEDLDVFSVEDVTDIGSGEPLFASYAYEDWALLGLRFEIHLLVHAFRRDLNDPERTAFHESHLAFYYNRYFKKAFTVKNYGVTKLEDLVDMIKDTVEISTKNGCLEAQLSDDTPMDNFVKLTEDHRRDRMRRLDAGDETAQLKFARPPPAAPPRQPPGAPPRSALQAAAGSGQKRPYSPGAPAAQPPRQQPRVGSYGGAPPRYGTGGGGAGSYRPSPVYGRNPYTPPSAGFRR